MDRVMPVPEALIGMRFDIAVSRMLGVSRSQAAAYIDRGEVSIAGRGSQRSAQKSEKLAQGDSIEVVIAEDRDKPEPVDYGMRIVYEDDDLVIVDKPVGMAAHPSVGWTGPTVLGTLKARGVHITEYGPQGRQGIVSRLDAGTSGLMLVCKSELAYKEMRRQFSEHEVTKIYYAVAQGSLKQDKATVDAPIGRDPVADFRFTIMPDGRPAITHWDVMERFGEATYISVNLETGRTHQIRVHMSSIGHPLVGDTMYGANPVLARGLGIGRQWLHSMKLEFKHPHTRLVVHVESELPGDLSRSLETLHARSRKQRQAV